MGRIGIRFTDTKYPNPSLVLTLKSSIEFDLKKYIIKSQILKSKESLKITDN